MTTPAERTEAMTEPTRAQIEEAHKFAINYGADRGYYYEFQGDDIANLIAHIRREARNAALEEAAKLSESHMIQLGDLHITALSGSEQNYNTILRRAAKAIRALKDQP